MVQGMPTHTGGQPIQFRYSIRNARKIEARKKKRDEERERGREGDGKASDGLSRPLEGPEASGTSPSSTRVIRNREREGKKGSGEVAGQQKASS